MRKILFSLTLLFALSITAFASDSPGKESGKKNQNERKVIPSPQKAGLCLAIFELPCGVVFNFMDCADMECITDYGWASKWNGYNTQFCSPIQLQSQPQFF